MAVLYRNLSRCVSGRGTGPACVVKAVCVHLCCPLFILSYKLTLYTDIHYRFVLTIRLSRMMSTVNITFREMSQLTLGHTTLLDEVLCVFPPLFNAKAIICRTRDIVGDIWHSFLRFCKTCSKYRIKLFTGDLLKCKVSSHKILAHSVLLS